MEFAEFRTLKTEHLVLRKLRLEDAPVFFERLGGSEEVTRYMLWNPHRNISESVASIEKALRRYEEGTYYRWAITLQGNDELVGIIDLLGFDERTNTCSFAYMLAQEFWGRGFGTEALQAVLDFAFRELKVAAVEADHFLENGASGAVMRKAGMIYQGTIKGKYEKNGVLHDAPLYRITIEEWVK